MHRELCYDRLGENKRKNVHKIKRLCAASLTVEDKGITACVCVCVCVSVYVRVRENEMDDICETSGLCAPLMVPRWGSMHFCVYV